MRGLVILVALLSIAGAAAAQERAQRERGEQLVRMNCGRCHAVGETGRSPNRAAPPMRELHRRYSLDALANALDEGMLKGHPAMPQFNFSQADINAIIAYLRSIQTNQPASLPSSQGR